MFLSTSTENLQQTQRLQYSRQYNLQVLASVQSKQKRSETKYIGGVFYFSSRSTIPEVDEKITEKKKKMIKYLNKIYDIKKRLPET